MPLEDKQVGSFANFVVTEDTQLLFLHVAAFWSYPPRLNRSFIACYRLPDFGE